MNTKLAIPFLAILAFAQGCIITGPHGRNPGNVTFSWTFYGGQTCAQAGVANVLISIPGESLENGGMYPCIANGYPGIVLHNFNGGVYTYTIQGLDLGGSITYEASGDFTIDGDVLEQVDLTPYGQPGSQALVTWTFPNNVTCANADTPAGYYGGVKYVDIDIDGNAVRANCADGAIANGGQGVYSALVAPGSHTITLSALGAYTPPGAAEQTYQLFYASHALTTTSGTPVSDQAALQWAVGGAVVSWALQSSTGAAQTCTGTGNPTVYVNFADSTNTPFYPVSTNFPGDPNQCNAAPTRYFYLPAAAGGTNWRIDLQAGLTSPLWLPLSRPVVTVMPGVFPADNTAITVPLRQQ